jgi:hypothetical protein
VVAAAAKSVDHRTAFNLQHVVTTATNATTTFTSKGAETTPRPTKCVGIGLGISTATTAATAATTITATATTTITATATATTTGHIGVHVSDIFGTSPEVDLALITPA